MADNYLAKTAGQQPQTQAQQNLLQQLWDEASGAFARYGRRSGKQRDDSIALMNYASAPGTDPLTGAGLKALGLAGLVTHPLAFFPTREEWDERLTNAGNDSRVSRSIGGFLSDLPSLIDPQMAAGGAALAAAPIAAKMAKPGLGRGLGDLMQDAANNKELDALGARLQAEAAQTGGAPSSVSREQALGRLIGEEASADYQIPDTWYHGSPADIYGPDGSGKFRLTAGETGVPALWASNEPFTAEGYSRGEIALQYDDAAGKFPLTRSWYKDYDGGGGVYGLKSAAKNPLVVDGKSKNWVNANMGAILREAKQSGHDAVIFRNVADNYHAGGPASDIAAFLDETAFTPDRK